MQDYSVKNPWSIYITLLISSFITIEAAAFQSPAVPSIARDFGVSAGLASLVVLIYYIAVVSFSPIFGRVADRFGRKKVLTIGLIMFVASESLAAVCPTYLLLLVARFAQGFSVACILPVILSYVSFLFPPDKRGMPIGVLVFAMSFGASTGGLVGGLLIDSFGWRSIYAVSAVMALVGLLIVLWKTPETPTNQDEYSLDWHGALLLLLSVGSLLSTPTWISHHGMFSLQALLAFGMGVSGLVVLWHVEQRVKNPVLDISILRERNFFLPGIIFILMLICYTATVYALAFFVNDRPGGNASQVGLVNMFVYGTAMMAGLISGKLSDRFNERSMLICIACLMFFSLWFYSTIELTTPLWLVAFIATFLGFVQGMKSPVLTKLAVSTVPPNRASTGSGLFSMMRDFGSPAGVSIGLSLYSTILAGRTEKSLFLQSEQYEITPPLMEDFHVAFTSKGTDISSQLTEHLNTLGTDFPSLYEQSQLVGMSATLPQLTLVLSGILAVALLLILLLPKTKQGLSFAPSHNLNK